MDPESTIKLKKAGINTALFLNHVIKPPTPTEILIEPKKEIIEVIEPEPIQETKSTDAQLESKSYNLRSLAPVKRPKRRVTTLKRPKIGTFSEVDVTQYHHCTDAISKKLLDLTKCSLKTQIDAFVDGTDSFVVVSWLNTARIFEYQSKQEEYLEIRRIPGRYISLSSQIITCLHHSNSVIYLGYMWGDKEGSDEKKFKPYIERRNIKGELIEKPYYYDYVLKSIYSDDGFIYVQTNVNIIYIHRRELFSCVQYQVNFSPLTTNPLIGTWVELPRFKTYTRLPIITTTTKELLVTQYDAFEHRVIQCFKFDDEYNTVAIEKLHRLIIVHRNSASSSKIEFGFMSKVSESKDYLFIHEATISFNHQVIQIKQHKMYLYIFSRCKTKYELGCILLPSLRPLWTTQLKNVDDTCHIVAHDEHIAIVKRNQEISTFKPKSTQINRESMFNKLTIETNRHLQTLGASVFQKLQ